MFYVVPWVPVGSAIDLRKSPDIFFQPGYVLRGMTLYTLENDYLWRGAEEHLYKYATQTLPDTGPARRPNVGNRLPDTDHRLRPRVTLSFQFRNRDTTHPILIHTLPRPGSELDAPA